MTDVRTREAERCWLASRSVEDEAAYLSERVRTGDLQVERLEAAAALGAQVAVRVLGRALDLDLPQPRMFGGVSHEACLQRLPDPPLERTLGAGAALLGELLPKYEEERPGTCDALHRLLALIDDYLKDPCAERLSAAHEPLERQHFEDCPAGVWQARLRRLNGVISCVLYHSVEESLVALMLRAGLRPRTWPEEFKPPFSSPDPSPDAKSLRICVAAALPFLAGASAQPSSWMPASRSGCSTAVLRPDRRRTRDRRSTAERQARLQTRRPVCLPRGSLSIVGGDHHSGGLVEPHVDLVILRTGQVHLLEEVE